MQYMKKANNLRKGSSPPFTDYKRGRVLISTRLRYLLAVSTTKVSA